MGRKRWGEEIPMDRKMKQILEPGMELTHIYDFGSSTDTAIKAVDAREGKPLSKHPIYLMARNIMPEVSCDECGKQARWLSENYTGDYSRWMAFCDKHIASYSGENYSESYK